MLVVALLQGPPDFIPPDPNIIIPLLMPVIGMLTGVLITGFVALGPIGRAIGDVIRHLFGAKSKDQAALGSGDTDEIIGRLDNINQTLAELAERQEFSERMLSQVRRDRALPGDKDVAG